MDLSLVEQVFERRHTTRLASAAEHNGRGLLVDLGGRITEVGERPSNCVEPMTVVTMRPVEDVAFVHRLTRCIYANRWLGWAAVAKGGNFQFCSPTKGKRENPAEPWLCDSPFWKILDTRVASPSRHHRDVLHTIQHIGYGRGQDSRSGVIFPEFLPVGRAIRQEDSVGAALKHKVPSRSKHSSRLHTWMGHMPNLTLFDWVPRDEFAYRR